MAFFARSNQTGSNGVQTYAYPFTVLDEDEIRVVVDGVQLADFTVDVDAGEVTIGTSGTGHTFVGGEALTISRVTPLPNDDRYVQPTNEGPLSSTALGRLQLQLLHSLQELADAFEGTTWEEGTAGALFTRSNPEAPITALPPGEEGQVLVAHGEDEALTWEEPTLGTSTATEVKESIGLIESRAFNFGSPTVGASEPAWYTTRDVEVTSITAVLIGSSSPSVDINIRHSTDRSATGSTVLTADATITSTSTGTSVTSGFDDATIPAGSWVWLDVTAVSGTVDWLHVNMTGTPAVPA